MGTTSGGGESKAAAQRRLSADDWAEAALAAIGEGGLAAVAVEPLAARLGTTKGSFYWHFPNRRALVEVVLLRWEREHTESIITEIETEQDPADRLRRLVTVVVEYSRHDHIEMALLANAADPLVAPVVHRVTERRVAYVASLYEELGLPVGDARRRAVFAVSVYLGHVQLAHAAPDTLPLEPDLWRRHVEDMIDALLPASSTHG